MIADPQRLLVAGLELVVRTFPKFFAATRSTVRDIAHLVIHQVSAKHTDRFIEAIQANPARVCRLYPEFGNLGSGGIPTVLSKLADTGKITRSDWVVLGGIGSGLNCAVMGIAW